MPDLDEIGDGCLKGCGRSLLIPQSISDIPLVILAWLFMAVVAIWSLFGAASNFIKGLFRREE